MPRLAAGSVLAPFTLTALDGSVVAVPGPGRHAEIAAAGITEVTFFHSAAEHLRGYQADLPFAVIADPDRVYYHRFGMERACGHWPTRGRWPRPSAAAGSGWLIAANRTGPGWGRMTGPRIWGCPRTS
nr:hypothetical protein [Mycobacterium sp. DL592]